MIAWLDQNKEWFFSGIGVAMLISFLNLINGKIQKRRALSMVATMPIEGNNIPTPRIKTQAELKQQTRILFVDDDTSFKVVKILKNDGWPHVRIVKDIASLTSPELIEASILFIDIQGVGKALSFSDEGLGLAYAIKQKYPAKKVVIYSSQTTGERFHRALQHADYSLPKNADPYEFITLVEDFSGAPE